jgi:excisionase family DNA binding protein
VEQAAEILQIGRDHVYRLLRTWRLRSIKIGKLRRIHMAWVTELIALLETTTSTRLPVHPAAEMPLKGVSS